MRYCLSVHKWIKPNLLVHPHKGLGRVGHHLQGPHGLFGRRGSQVAVPPMGYEDGLLIPWMLDESWVSICVPTKAP